MEVFQVYFKDPNRSVIYSADSLSQIFAKIQQEKDAWDILEAEYNAKNETYIAALEAAQSQEEKDAIIPPSVEGYTPGSKGFVITAISALKDVSVVV